MQPLSIPETRLPLGPSASSVGGWARERGELGLQAEKKKTNKMKTQNFLYRRLSPLPALATSSQSSPVWAFGTWPGLLLLSLSLQGRSHFSPDSCSGSCLSPVQSGHCHQWPWLQGGGRPVVETNSCVDTFIISIDHALYWGRPGCSVRTLLEGTASFKRGSPKAGTEPPG